MLLLASATAPYRVHVRLPGDDQAMVTPTLINHSSSMFTVWPDTSILSSSLSFFSIITSVVHIDLVPPLRPPPQRQRLDTHNPIDFCSVSPKDTCPGRASCWRVRASEIEAASIGVKTESDPRPRRR